MQHSFFARKHAKCQLQRNRGLFLVCFSLTGVSVSCLFGLGFVGKGLNVTANEKMKPVMQNTSQTGHTFSERQGGGRRHISVTYRGRAWQVHKKHIGPHPDTDTFTLHSCVSSNPQAPPPRALPKKHTPAHSSWLECVKVKAQSLRMIHKADAESISLNFRMMLVCDMIGSSLDKSQPPSPPERLEKVSHVQYLPSHSGLTLWCVCACVLGGGV